MLCDCTPEPSRDDELLQALKGLSEIVFLVAERKGIHELWPAYDLAQEVIAKHEKRKIA